ncbi:MAG: enoyl-CoA hydratase [Myxococcales bacterium]|nr:enoyl-CoA hydratase [Myxococcales bacterium]
MYEQILYEVKDPIATITLNRPDRLNAYTTQMGDELKHAVAAAESDPKVVAIIVTGAGRGFCAGADMGDLKKASSGDSDFSSGERLEANPGDPEMTGFRAPLAYLHSVRKPIIAAINGPVAGIGLAMVLFCDVRFASDTAVFTTAFAQRGLIAEWGLAWTLPRLVGQARATDLILSARKVRADEAGEMGLVNKVVPGDELMNFAETYARDLGTNCSPLSLQIMKRQIYTGLHQELDEAMSDAISLMNESLKRPDFKEGVDSFLEKRAPNFGRVGG